jgi:Ca2+-transporting ATPase
VFRLAKRKALVRRAVTVENIGRVSVICSDKTGTITEGKLHLTHILPVETLSEEQLCLLGGLASRQDSGDPMDQAIFRKTAISDGAPLVRRTTFPFTEDRKRETAILQEPSGQLLAAPKGAVEIILAASTLSSAERELWQSRAAELRRPSAYRLRRSP